MLALKEFDTRRIKRISSVENTHKVKFAQYLTPVEIASFMAQITMRYFKPFSTVDILDPGAGTGILSCSLVNELSLYSKLVRLSNLPDGTIILNLVPPPVTNGRLVYFLPEDVTVEPP